MNLVELFSISFEALRERRLRASLTILMVVMGASLIVALDGTGNGFTTFIDNQFSTLGANVLILNPRSQSFKMDKMVVDAISRLDGVSEVVPFIQQISPISSGREEQMTVVVGVDQSKLPLLFPTISLQSGHSVAATDSIGILLGGEVAHLSSPEGAFAALGETVRVNYQKYEGGKSVTIKRAFNVRGILDTLGSGVVPVDTMVFTSLPAANSLYGRGGSYDGTYVVTERPELNNAVRDRIRGRYGGDINIVSPQAIADAIDRITSGVYLFIGIVASVSLMVASVGIVTTLHTSMMERIKEIGLLKALGFNNALVLSLFLNEAAIIGIIGGTLGIVSGMGLSQVMSLFVGRNIRIGAAVGRGFAVEIIPWFDPLDLLSTWALCVVLSMVAGFYPAWRASRLDPVVALRHE